MAKKIPIMMLAVVLAGVCAYPSDGVVDEVIDAEMGAPSTVTDPAIVDDTTIPPPEEDMKGAEHKLKGYGMQYPAYIAPVSTYHSYPSHGYSGGYGNVHQGSYGSSYGAGYGGGYHNGYQGSMKGGMKGGLKGGFKGGFVGGYQGGHKGNKGSSTPYYY